MNYYTENGELFISSDMAKDLIDNIHSSSDPSYIGYCMEDGDNNIKLVVCTDVEEIVFNIVEDI